jgi:hypothetical protein
LAPVGVLNARTDRLAQAAIARHEAITGP